MTAAGPGGEGVPGELLDDDPELLWDRAPCGQLTTTPEGLVTRVNSTFLDWTGLSREDVVGRRTFASLLSPGGRIYHETHYAPMLRLQGAAREIALDLITADGSRLPVLVNAVLERDQAGEPQVVRVAVLEATERREYERELRRERDRAEQSEVRARALAQTLQQTLIPPTPPHVPGLDVAAVYRPAGTGEEVGGDLYDVFQVAERGWVVVLGDVCGKGVEAAVVTALVRYTLRAASVQTADTAQALDQLNDVLIAHGSERYCTVILLRLTQEEGRWRVRLSAGGHPLPLLVAPGRDPRPLGVPGPLVGVFPGLPREEVRATLEPGETLLLYTDGVTEARRGAEMYDDLRLHQLVAANLGSATALTTAVLADVLDYQRDLPRDDIALVAVRVPTG